MSIKKLCSIGLLNINLNLILKKSFTEDNNFNIDDYNSIVDLKKIFFPIKEVNPENSSKENNNIDYIEYISLTSEDNLMNTLLFINRAYKVKTFIEFLIPNEIKFKKNNYFLKSLINEILNRNYFFVVENNIINKSSKIKFIIKIVDDENDEIISKKEFNLVEEEEYDDIENDIFDNKYFESYKLNFDFSKNNFFFIDLDSIKSLKWKTNEDLVLFILSIIKNEKIKIILSINENSLIINEKIYAKDNNKEIIDDILKTNKSIIESSDIIFFFKNSMNHFLKEYSNKSRTKILKINNKIKPLTYSPTFTHKFFNSSKENLEQNLKTTNQDLILYDNNKYRKNIPRLSVILDDFDYLTLYKQEFEESASIEINIEPYYENFCFSLLNKNHTIQEFKEIKKILENNSDKYFHIFIGGFLSRYINNVNLNEDFKNYEECFIAGNLILKNYLILLKNNIDYITDIDEYNVEVPKIKKCLREILYKEKKEELRKIRKKEQKFVLDCTNPSKSQKKEYDSLLDFNCTSFLSKKNIINHLAKNNFFNQNIQNKKTKNEKEVFKKNYLLRNRLEKTPKYNYYNKDNYLNLIGIINTPLINNKNNRFINSNNESKKIMFKRIYNSYDKKKDKINHNDNKSSNKINNITLPIFINKNKINGKKYYNKNIININVNKNIKKLNIKIPSLNLLKKKHELKNRDKNISSSRKRNERFDTSINNFDIDYIKYLFKLYQPKKKFNTFLYNISNLKPKK